MSDSNEHQPTPLNLLIIEDRPGDAELIAYELRNAGYIPVWQRVETEADYLAALDPALDLILADFSLPQFDGLRALELLLARGLDIPFIIVSGMIGEEVAVAAMRMGATDYLLKDRLARLGTAVSQAIEQRRLRAEARRINAALQESAKLNQAVLRALTAQIAVLDPHGTIVATNDAWEQFARMSGDPQLRTTGIGINYLDVCRRAAEQSHDSEAALTLAGVQALLNGSQPYFSLEYKCPTPTELRWYLMNGMPLAEHTGVVIAHEDITERKRAEQARLAAETNYRMLVDHIPAIVYQAAIDTNNSMLYVNPHIETMLGFTAEEWTADPQRWRKQLYKDDINSILESAARAYQSNTPIHTEFRMLARDGRVLWFHDEAVVIRDANGQPRFLQGVMLDITDRKQAEQALQESEARYRLITENTSDLISMTDQNGCFVYVSPSYQAVLGYDPATLIGQSATHLIHSDDQNSEQTSESQSTQRWRHADQSWRWIDVHATTAIQQNIVYYVRIGRDITERRKIENQFYQAQKMESIGQLAGGLAHDFNNMLSIVIGFIGSAQEELPENSPAQRALKIAEQSAWRGSQLTRQLLTFARKQMVELRILNLNTVIADLHPMLRRLIGEDIEFVTLFEAHLGYVKADIGQLEQVLTNLVVNARDAMPNGGKLVIKTTNTVVESENLKQPLIPSGDYVLLSISDTGNGMETEVLQHIFEPFFTTKEIGKGSGLGLATCYSIIKQHGGTILVDSSVGYGTTFTIYLTRVAATGSLAANGEQTSILRGTETVLLVEDEPLVRELERSILQEQGYVVIEAANGDEAWRMVQEIPDKTITLLITDIVMPQLGGKALAELIAHRYPDIKILFVSGYANDSMAEHGQFPAEPYFLAKPFTRTAFARKVREVLDAGSL